MISTLIFIGLCTSSITPLEDQSYRHQSNTFSHQAIKYTSNQKSSIWNTNKSLASQTCVSSPNNNLSIGLRPSPMIPIYRRLVNSIAWKASDWHNVLDNLPGCFLPRMRPASSYHWHNNCQCSTSLSVLPILLQLHALAFPQGFFWLWYFELIPHGHSLTSVHSDRGGKFRLPGWRSTYYDPGDPIFIPEVHVCLAKHCLLSTTLP